MVVYVAFDFRIHLQFDTDTNFHRPVNFRIWLIVAVVRIYPTDQGLRHHTHCKCASSEKCNPSGIQVPFPLEIGLRKWPIRKLGRKFKKVGGFIWKKPTRKWGWRGRKFKKVGFLMRKGPIRKWGYVGRKFKKVEGFYKKMVYKKVGMQWSKI